MFAAPACASCGQQMRLASIEPHDRFARLDVRQFACGCGCGASASYVILRHD
jgi:hypothetical protein